jgi:hypothetical protein
MARALAQATRPLPAPRRAASPPRVTQPAPAARLQPRCACGGRCPSCQGPKAADHGGAAEQEAERRTADLPPPARAGAASGSPPQQPTSGGRPLTAAERQRHGARVGGGLDTVHVHDGADAQAAAAGLQAHGFSVDNHVWLGRPAAAVSARVFAHELVHATRHRDGRLHRYPYETVGVDLRSTSVAGRAGESYWDARTLAVYAASYSARMLSDVEERDAVLSALWANSPPTTVAAASSMLVPIAPRQRPPASAGVPATTAQRLWYLFSFSPPSTDPQSAEKRPGLRIEFVAAGTAPPDVSGARAEHTVAADYRERDIVSLELERLQALPNAADRLGQVTLPGGLSAVERIGIRHAVWSYFEYAKTRNAEVDALVPQGSGGDLLVTLNFGANNDVVVTKIGVAGSGAGQVDTARLDVRRVRGFPGEQAGTAALRSWWATRYPGAGTLTADTTPPAPDAAALVLEMNALLTSGVASADWFKTIYGVQLLDAAAAKTRLEGVHGVPDTLTGDLLDFSAADRVTLELALQTLADGERRSASGAKIARKTQSITSTRTKAGLTWSAGRATTYGINLWTGGSGSRQTTVLYFASLFNNNSRLWVGSSAGNALPEAAMNMLHELGHFTGNRSGGEASFNAWLQANPQAAPTWYAGSDPANELYPEAFALYHSDPHFLCGSAPLLYAWFDTLASSGTASGANAKLAAPAVCPG